MAKQWAVRNKYPYDSDIEDRIVLMDSKQEAIDYVKANDSYFVHCKVISRKVTEWKDTEIDQWW